MNQLKKEIIKSYPAMFLNQWDFDKSRALMFGTFSPDILNNDTIILLEYFDDDHGKYYYTIFESHDNSIMRYVAMSRINNGKVYVDSLSVSNVPDKILDMVRMGKLDEVKRRGDAAMITPVTTLIINIGVKNKEKEKFDFTTLITHGFSTFEYWFDRTGSD